MGVGKPRGLWAARQLRNHRRDQKSLICYQCVFF